MNDIESRTCDSKLTVEISPASEFTIPMGNGREGSNNKEWTFGCELLGDCVHVGSCLDCFSVDVIHFKGQFVVHNDMKTAQRRWRKHS